MNSSSEEADCFACRIQRGEIVIPGGTVFRSLHWVVEHELASLGLGSFVVKPIRHCTQLAELTRDEALELGPLLQTVTQTTQALTGCDQVYACSWSHSNWRPVHVHFVIQPAWNADSARFERPGPFAQAAQFASREVLDPREVEAVCEKATSMLRSLCSVSPL